MQPLFVSATGTNVGKTHTTLQLIKGFGEIGIRIGVFKPIETGVKGLPHDASLLLEACSKYNPAFASLTPIDTTAYTFALPAAPFCADTMHEISIDHILQKYHQLSNLCDLLLIEGAGGLMVPITKEYKMIDLAKDLNAKMLLVTPSRLGCINDTLLSMEALKNRNIHFEWCVNLYEDKISFEKVSQPFYDAVFPGWWNIQTGLNRFISGYSL